MPLGSTWEGDTSRLVSPDTGLEQIIEVPRGCGAGCFIRSLSPLFYFSYSGTRGRTP